jgi:ribonuclease R
VLEGRVEDLPVGTAVLADITGERTADPSDEWDDPPTPTRCSSGCACATGCRRPTPTRCWSSATRPPGPRHRRDVRTLTTLTIDSPSSRDLDDALSVYPADPDGGIRVCVHIADVAAHVRPARRSTSRRAARRPASTCRAGPGRCCRTA